jgi:hypothetical protein
VISSVSQGCPYSQAIREGQADRNREAERQADRQSERLRQMMEMAEGGQVVQVLESFAIAQDSKPKSYDF